jgi:hypothetical protein
MMPEITWMLALACLSSSIAAAGKTVHVVFSNHFVSPAPQSMLVRLPPYFLHYILTTISAIIHCCDFRT